ncbi:DUF4226 domain-containing protein [Candidatus Mycobacterium wuenschmannii]|uniref:DUF4226 domain-containing protein n=1 Tax=Candidatus Mycobacterium wuenschmannii TaxID=3027808 RepID=A0ABY8VSL9_9MYCO|nr:DUF4226 domain-containing protein [Candidatus Mycobacterium wuenschmannii]WIM86629.1 DUF4226 domain-containing protein [Candidatus Mycobacterium wuenschmannii]
MADAQGQGAAGQAGGSIEASEAGQAALSARHAASSDADRALTEALAAAHAATVEATQRLDAIAADIDGAVANQAALALDTAMGAREFQKFLLTKQHEIGAVVAHARDLAGAAAAKLDGLREHYTAPAQD